MKKGTDVRVFVLAWLVLAVIGLPVRRGDAATPDYRIGIDDVLAISVWDNKDLDQVVFVRPDGKITLALIGQVQAGGRTVAELGREITEEYRKTVKGAVITVSVREIRSRGVFFLGAVAKPGPLQLTQDLTLLQALAAVGGFASAASPESAFVLRGDQRLAVDLGRLVQLADTTQNVKLEPGDTVVVPSAGMVYVQGEVRTPGAIPFNQGLTVVKAIAQTGGFTQAAAPKRVTVITHNGAKKVTVKVNVSDILAEPESTADLNLQPNDIVIVPQRLF
jgi:polysaccharide biosynthesis/export protein